MKYENIFTYLDVMEPYEEKEDTNDSKIKPYF